MPDFLMIYHGGTVPETQEEMDATMAAWGKWMSDHETKLVDPGNPVGLSKTVSQSGIADDGGPNPAAGYTIVKAGSIEEACEMAAANPVVAEGGTVEVAEIVEVEL